MSARDLEQLRTLTLELVGKIPVGRVMTYGQIAALIGYPGYARHVGHVLHGLLETSELPWQRVVSSSGRISTFKVGHGELQVALLEAEGVACISGRLSLTKYLWKPPLEL